MYNVSQNFLTAVKQAGGRQFKASVTINGQTFNDSNIVEISLSENCNPTESFVLGGAGSTELELELINLPTSLVLNNAPVTATISTLLGDNTTWEDVPLGIFTVETIEKNKSTVKLTCFDNMYKLELPYFSDLVYPATIQAVANEICTKAGIQLVTTLPNTLINKIVGYSYREAISFIASFLGGFAHFNRLGKLEIRTYVESGISVDGNIYYPPLKTSEKPFTIGNLACKVGDTTLTAGSGGNGISLENPIMTQEQLNSIYNTLKTLSYMPYTMDWIGNQAIEAGDKITITDDKGNTYNTLVMENKLTYKGSIKATTSAVGKTETGQNFNSGGSIKNNVDRIVIEQANIKLALIDKAEIKDLTAQVGRIDTLYTNVGSIQTLLAGNIGASNLAAGAIQAGSAVIANGAIASAQIISLDVVKLNAGNISTNKFTVQSDNGNLKILGDTVKLWDVNGKERVSLGLNSGDYNLLIRGADGTTVLFGTGGVTKAGITLGAVDDSKVDANANINGSKIEKESLVSQINGATTLLKASHIKYDPTGQTLDIAFSTLSSAVTSQGTSISNINTSISTMNGQIALKVSQTDINNSISANVNGRNLISNGDFENGTTSWILEGGAALSSSTYAKYGLYSIKRTLEGGQYYQYITIPNGHKIYFSAYCFIVSNTNNAPYIYCSDFGSSSNAVSKSFSTSTLNVWQFQSGIKISANGGIKICFGEYYDGGSCENYTDGILAVDLTTAFGAGKEPTQAWCDANITFNSVSNNVQTQIDSATTRITNAETSITQLNNSISLKASQISLDSTNGNVTNAQNTANTANGTANTLRDTTVPNLASRVSTAESSLSVQAGQIATKVTQTDIDNSVNDVQVGGRNLLLNSKPVVNGIMTGVTSNGATLSVDNANTYCGQPTLRVVGNAGFYFNDNPIVKPNTTYIVSMMVKGDSASTGSSLAPLHIQIPTGAHNYENILSTDSDITTSWKVIWKIFKSTSTTDTTFRVFLFNISQSCNVAWIKLELGNKATDWTPAPEDIQGQIDSATTRISTAETSITQLNNSIALKASQTSLDTTNNNVTTAQNTANMANGTANTLRDTTVPNLASRVSTAESTLTVQAGQIASKVDVNGVKSTIQQSASDVQIAFNNINSDVQNSGGTFGITNGKLQVKNANNVVTIDGSKNIFRILSSGNGALQNVSGTVSNTITIVHNLGFTPSFYGMVFESSDGTTKHRVYQTPHFFLDGNSVKASGGAEFLYAGIAAFVDMSADDTNLYITMIRQNAHLNSGNMTVFYRYFIYDTPAY